MFEIQPLVSAFAARDWYAVAVLGVVLLMGVITRADLWVRVPRPLQPLVPVAMGAVAGLADAWSAGEPWQVAVVQAVGAGLQIGLGAIGVHHARKRLVSGEGAADA